MDDDTERVLMSAGADAIKQQRRGKGLSPYPSDPVIIQRSAELLRKAAEPE